MTPPCSHRDLNAALLVQRRMRGATARIGLWSVRVRAVHAFAGEEDGDLPLRVGDEAMRASRRRDDLTLRHSSLHHARHGTVHHMIFHHFWTRVSQTRERGGRDGVAWRVRSDGGPHHRAEE